MGEKNCPKRVFLLRNAPAAVTGGGGLFAAKKKSSISSSTVEEGVDLHKKFGNAKAISSDMYFGKNEMDVSGVF